MMTPALSLCLLALLHCVSSSVVQPARSTEQRLSIRVLTQQLRGGAVDGGDAIDEDDAAGGMLDGAAAASPAASAATLSDADVTAKLNAVPVFVFLRDGQIQGVTNDEGEDEVTFFVDALQARERFAALQAADPGVEFRMGAMPLGAALQACGGWGREALDAELRLRHLAPSSALASEYGETLRQQLVGVGRDPGSWQLPVFVSNTFQTESMLPVFFCREDLAAGWVRAGRDEATLPQDAVVMDLRLFCEQLQSGMPGAEKVYIYIYIYIYK